MDGGAGAGINLTSSGNSNMTAHRNTVTGYGGDGIAASNLSSMTALYNTIDNVGGDAVQLSIYEVAWPHMHWNNIQGSTGYDVNLLTAEGGRPAPQLLVGDRRRDAGRRVPGGDQRDL